MRVMIHNLKSNILSENNGIIEAYKVFIDPGHKYAVVEVYHDELFIAIKIVSDERDLLAGEYVDHVIESIDVPMLHKYQVSWETIEYGFCKLILWAPEMVK